MADNANTSDSKASGNFSGGDTSTSKSNGNFSGFDKGYSGPSIDLGEESGPGAARGDFSFGANIGWVSNGNGATNIISGANYNNETGKTTIGGDNYHYNTSGGTSTYSGNSSSSSGKLTVDDVWSTNSGTGTVNRGSFSETQGDYATSKNEKSDVKTSTFGKQDSIVTNPGLVTQDKGLVDTSTIDSVNGIVSEKKDKESQEVLDSKKNRDRQEEKDVAGKVKDRLISESETEKEGDATDKEAEAVNAYKDELQKSLDEGDSKEEATDKAMSRYNELIEKYGLSKERPIEDSGAATAGEVDKSDISAAMEKAETEQGEDGKNLNDLNDIQEVVYATEDVRKLSEELAAKGDSLTEEDYVALQKSLETLAEGYKKVNSMFNTLEATNYNKDYVELIANVSMEKITLPDGTTKTVGEFIMDMSTKSPQISAALHRDKARQLEEEGHPTLAKIENWKADIATTWLGSKMDTLDNKVRDQFIRMSDLNMRAVHAAYDNVMSTADKNSDEYRNAEAALAHANLLCGGAAALKASTGLLSGLGDSVSDGVYGVTSPDDLSTYQKVLTYTKSITDIVLSLGVTPGAMESFEHLYYLNPDSKFLSKDFDGDGFAWCQEYGNSTTAGLISSGLGVTIGTALCFNPASLGAGLKMIGDSVIGSIDTLYSIRKDSAKIQKLTEELISYYKEAEELEGLPEEAKADLETAIKQIEDFKLKADEVDNIDSWLEGSGSNTTTNEKFNQSLTYDEWLKLIESDETMRNYAKGLIDKE